MKFFHRFWLLTASSHMLLDHRSLLKHVWAQPFLLAKIQHPLLFLYALLGWSRFRNWWRSTPVLIDDSNRRYVRHGECACSILPASFQFQIVHWLVSCHNTSTLWDFIQTGRTSAHQMFLILIVENIYFWAWKWVNSHPISFYRSQRFFMFRSFS